jgi:hypothetical protein
VQAGDPRGRVVCSQLSQALARCEAHASLRACGLGTAHAQTLSARIIASALEEPGSHAVSHDTPRLNHAGGAFSINARFPSKWQ